MQKENLNAVDCIRTVSGKYIKVFDPKPEDIDIYDIAHALSNMPRFAGHLPNFYSVCAHSLRCCNLAPQELKLQALLHDASEAYLMDIPRPIKARMPEYKIIEEKLMAAIAARFRFEWPMHERIKQIDNEVLQEEWDILMLQGATSTPDQYKWYRYTRGDMNPTHKNDRELHTLNEATVFVQMFQVLTTARQ